VSRREAAEALGVAEDCMVLVPADKGLSPEWIDSLYQRGAPTVSTGTDLRYIGMPVGGGCCGELYLGGDGRLWRWDVLNAAARSTSDQAYANPPVPSSPFRQAFAVRITRRGTARIWTLDAAGFDDVRFTGQYPIGRVEYRAPDCPVAVTLDAFSPFVPLETQDSTRPATVLVYDVHSLVADPLQVEVLGFTESPVLLTSRAERPVELSAAAFSAASLRGVEFSGAGRDAGGSDIVFEDWESAGFGGWQVSGSAFGSGPVDIADVPAGMRRYGDLNVRGRRFVTSYAFTQPDGDGPVGRLTSPGFTIERNFITLRLGGGNHPGSTCANVVVGDTVVASATGTDTEPLIPVSFDVTPYHGQTAHLEIVDTASGPWGHVSVDAIVFTDRPDIVFENWERTDYAGWTVQGDAFGAGPVTVDEVPDLMKRFGGFNALGQRFVTSYAFRASGDPDSRTGKLTSKPFTIERRYLLARVGGGNHPGQTCLNVLVDGSVIGTATGADAEPMTAYAFDLAKWQGRTATVEIVDEASGGWAHVNVDAIIFSDHGRDDVPFADLTDNGTFALAALDLNAVVRPSIADWSSPDSWFNSPAAPASVDGGERSLAGTVTVPLSLQPHASVSARFVLSWHFPVPDRQSLSFLTDIATLRRHYARDYPSARAVAADLAAALPRLEHETRLWVQTWYTDSTLPHWFLERTFATASTLSTSTCYRFDNGRFYGWEGVYCCAGTCEHVWNYAQSVARLFPDLERDTRARVDLGIGMNPATGEIGNRAEADRGWAADGQCGTVLRIYREHQMSPDSAFLAANWPRIRLALGFLIGHDAGSDGTLDGAQPNTLDTAWFGHIAWISGMYIAALLAGAEMADDVGDAATAARCRNIAELGIKTLAADLWNGEYFIQTLDAAHKDTINSNVGCHIDQMFGQSLAAQLNLPRVFDADQSRQALEKIYRYNFAPDPVAYEKANTAIPMGRVFAMAKEPGVVMTTWPHCGAEIAPGKPASWAAMYFNEIWTGQEYQLATQMLYDGVVDQGLIVTRAVHDRYAPAKRNPYNEIECGEHYARAMAGYGVFLGACGFEHHGPRQHLGFAPRLTPDDFAAAFTANTGWGLYRQRRHGREQTSEIEVRHGHVDVRSLALQTPGTATGANVEIGDREIPVTLTAAGTQAQLHFGDAQTVAEGETLTIHLHYP
jgi:uncharacterized protein (DUF608 family)